MAARRHIFLDQNMPNYIQLQNLCNKIDWNDVKSKTKTKISGIYKNLRDINQCIRLNFTCSGFDGICPFVYDPKNNRMIHTDEVEKCSPIRIAKCSYTHRYHRHRKPIHIETGYIMLLANKHDENSTISCIPQELVLEILSYLNTTSYCIFPGIVDVHNPTIRNFTELERSIMKYSLEKTIYNAVKKCTDYSYLVGLVKALSDWQELDSARRNLYDLLDEINERED